MINPYFDISLQPLSILPSFFQSCVKFERVLHIWFEHPSPVKMPHAKVITATSCLKLTHHLCRFICTRHHVMASLQHSALPTGLLAPGVKAPWFQLLQQPSYCSFYLARQNRAAYAPKLTLRRCDVDTHHNKRALISRTNVWRSGQPYCLHRTLLRIKCLR